MIKQFQRKLILWGNINFKKYDWRFNRTPYSVFISEIMLHRTNARQVVPVYRKFMSTYPNIQSIVKANLSDIQDIMKSLGLLWRANKLYDSAEILYNRYDGNIPDNREELIELPGISDYIASAILCFGYSKRVIIIDTNTVRITGRLHNMNITDASRRSKSFRKKIELIMDFEHVVEFNYALLDLGATVCTARNPKCVICPVLNYCAYGKSLQVKESS